MTTSRKQLCCSMVYCMLLFHDFVYFNDNRRVIGFYSVSGPLETLKCCCNLITVIQVI